MSIIEKLIFNEVITDEDIAEELEEICDRVHSKCHEDCPVYMHNDSAIVYDENTSNCACFKNGKAMLTFLRNA